MREFVRQQIIELESSLNCIIYLIHDNARQFNLSYLDYGIKEIKTSVLDYFLILNKKQLKNILTEYIDYHNSLRPHQGIDQQIPDGSSFSKDGIIKKKNILGGLHSHYYRDAA